MHTHSYFHFYWSFLYQDITHTTTLLEYSSNMYSGQNLLFGKILQVLGPPLIKMQPQYNGHFESKGDRSGSLNCIGLLLDTQNCGLHMRQECRKRFPCHWLQRKPLASDPSMHHGTCVMHVPWCMSGLLTRGGRENVPGRMRIPQFYISGTRPMMANVHYISRIIRADHEFLNNLLWVDSNRFTHFIHYYFTDNW